MRMAEGSALFHTALCWKFGARYARLDPETPVRSRNLRAPFAIRDRETRSRTRPTPREPAPVQSSESIDSRYGSIPGIDLQTSDQFSNVDGSDVWGRFT